MGILCDLFVSTREEALEYESATADNEARLARYAPVEWKGLTSLEFGTLWALLDGQDWDVEKHMLIDVAIGEEGETWLHQFPDDYLALLKDLDAPRLARAAEAWSQTEEISWPVAELVPVIESMVQLAKDATSRKLGLFMWGSL